MTTPPDSSPDRISPNKGPEPWDQPSSLGKTPEGFDSLMEGAKNRPSAPTPGAPGTQGPTPLEIARGPSISGTPTFESILGQTKQAQDTLGEVEKRVKHKNLKLKRSQNHLIKQKLSDANSHIRAAGSKLGIDLPEDQKSPSLGGLSRFIAMINHGQNQLVAVQEQLKNLAKKGTNINPGDMLSVQVKMGLATQEIEYTSTLLGKVIQSVTQLMNTQL